MPAAVTFFTVAGVWCQSQEQFKGEAFVHEGLLLKCEVLFDGA